MENNQSFLKFKIPTILGLGVLVVGLVGGVFLTSQSQVFQTKASQSPTPTNIGIVNLSATSASIFWQTEQPTTGFLKAGTQTLNLTASDDRDLGAPQPHLLHFVTLQNLSPNTAYNFQIYSGTSSFSPKDSSHFTTTASLPPTNLPALFGKVTDQNNQPISESVITLEIPGAQKIATISKVAGNFILPLSEIKTANLLANFEPNATVSATLSVTNTKQSSTVVFNFPTANPQLPPITLGHNINLVTLAASSSASPSARLTLAETELKKYDLNKDGKLNSLDISTVLKNFGKNPKNKNTDFNGDGVVDQKDLDLISQYTTNASP